MNVSTVSNYQAMASLASRPPTNITGSQPIANQYSSSSQADSISISTQGQVLSQTSHHLKTDPIEVFLDWKNNGGESVTLGQVEKPLNQLLPENQQLIDQLRSQQVDMDLNDKKLMDARISVIQQFGDEEMFTSAIDADKRLEAESKAATLQIEYLTQKNGKSPINMSNSLENIHEHRAFNQNTSKENESDIPSLTKRYSPENLTSFNNTQYLESLLQLHNKGDD